MDLKEFIEETISAIADATSELQEKYSPDDVLINPPAAQSGSEVYHDGSANYTFRRVQSIEFDVAVTAASEKTGKGKAGIKVLSIELGGEGGKSLTAQQVSRVSSSVPMTLKPSEHETANIGEKKRIAEKNRGPIRNRGGNKWMGS